MTYRGHVKNGQILLDQAVQLPEGTAVHVEVSPHNGWITRPVTRVKPPEVEPIVLPGPPLSEDVVRDRR